MASIGLREQDAGERNIRVGRFPFYANGKAVASHAGEGLIKTIFDGDTGALLGAHMIGEGVTELIQGFAIAITLETTEQELMETVFLIQRYPRRCMRVCCKRLGAQFTCKRGFLTQVLRFRRVAGKALKESLSAYAGRTRNLNFGFLARVHAL